MREPDVFCAEEQHAVHCWCIRMMNMIIMDVARALASPATGPHEDKES